MPVVVMKLYIIIYKFEEKYSIISKSSFSSLNVHILCDDKCFFNEKQILK